MQIRFRCGKCNSSVRADASHAGKQAKCPKCGSLLQIPSAEQIAAAQHQAHAAHTAATGGRILGEREHAVAAPPPTRLDDGDFDIESPASHQTSAAVPPPITPYHSPQATRPVTYAGFWKRFAALFIDQILLWFITFAIGFILGVAVALGGGDLEGLELSFNLIGVVISWLYFASMESSNYQGTLGKLALNIKVTDLEGRPISFGRATGRFFAKIVSALTLGIGYVMAGFTEKKQALHDMIAGCLVVNR